MEGKAFGERTNPQRKSFGITNERREHKAQTLPARIYGRKSRRVRTIPQPEMHNPSPQPGGSKGQSPVSQRPLHRGGKGLHTNAASIKRRLCRLGSMAGKVVRFVLSQNRKTIYLLPKNWKSPEKLSFSGGVLRGSAPKRLPQRYLSLRLYSFLSRLQMRSVKQPG